MHEVAIAEQLLEVIRDTAAANGGGKVTGAHLILGELSGVDPDTLSFAFEAATRDDPVLASCSLTIERVPLRVHCNGCGYEGSCDPFAGCPTCGASSFTVLEGRELRLSTIDLEEEA